MHSLFCYNMSEKIIVEVCLSLKIIWTASEMAVTHIWLRRCQYFMITTERAEWWKSVNCKCNRLNIILLLYRIVLYFFFLFTYFILLLAVSVFQGSRGAKQVSCSSGTFEVASCWTALMLLFKPHQGWCCSENWHNTTKIKQICFFLFLYIEKLVLNAVITFTLHLAEDSGILFHSR